MIDLTDLGLDFRQAVIDMLDAGLEVLEHEAADCGLADRCTPCPGSPGWVVATVAWTRVAEWLELESWWVL